MKKKKKNKLETLTFAKVSISFLESLGELDAHRFFG